ncbi:DUF6233 domain-containing protein [Streptomyces sp. NPDC093546]|uniref:DUF6233 domain-containing protein n=1 Tax=Streptomyces sp. NPDC093546 TaxID=3366040 RepID=UPI0037F2D950
MNPLPAPRPGRDAAATPDLPPDLPRLLVIENWLELYLDRVRQAIAVRRREQAAAPQPSVPFEPTTAYRLERRRDQARTPVRVHLADCRMPGHPTPLTEQEARRALMRPGIEECPYRRPGTEPGILD